MEFFFLDNISIRPQTQRILNTVVECVDRISRDSHHVRVRDTRESEKLSSRSMVRGKRIVQRFGTLKK